jgi:hypothetical protein
MYHSRVNNTSWLLANSASTSASFTHRVCPECASHHYADFLGDKPQGQ